MSAAVRRRPGLPCPEIFTELQPLSGEAVPAVADAGSVAAGAAAFFLEHKTVSGSPIVQVVCTLRRGSPMIRHGIVAAVLALVACGGSSTPSNTNFGSVSMIAANEVPPKTSAGTGNATYTVNGTTVHFKITYNTL